MNYLHNVPNNQLHRDVWALIQCMSQDKYEILEMLNDDGSIYFRVISKKGKIHKKQFTPHQLYTQFSRKYDFPYGGE